MISILQGTTAVAVVFSETVRRLCEVKGLEVEVTEVPDPRVISLKTMTRVYRLDKKTTPCIIFADVQPDKATEIFLAKAAKDIKLVCILGDETYEPRYRGLCRAITSGVLTTSNVSGESPLWEQLSSLFEDPKECKAMFLQVMEDVNSFSKKRGQL